MCVGQMADIWEKMEKIDPLAHGLSENLMQTESKLIEGGARAVGADFVAEEAQRNQDKPGEGWAKATLFALPFLTGGASAGGQVGALAGQTGQAATAASLTAEDLAMMQAAGQMGGLAPEAWAGYGGMGVAQNGLGSGGLLSQMQGAWNNPSSLMSSNGLLANTGRTAMSNMAGGGASGNKMQMMRMGMGMMEPQQPQGPMPSAPPRGQQDPGPLASPYQQGMNSMDMPPPGMSMEQWMELKRRRMGGGYVR